MTESHGAGDVTRPASRRRSSRLSSRLVLWLCVGAAAPLHARTLSDQLHEFLDQNGFPTHGQFIEAITPIVEKQAARGVDFPATATALGFTYRFNFETGVPERSSSLLGPVFTERADTVGKGRFDLGLSYLHADLTQFNGQDFAGQIATSATIPIGGIPVTQSFAANHFSLVSDIVSFSGTYGVSDRFDLNALVPIVQTSLDMSGTATARAPGLGSNSEALSFSGSAFGVGDTLLRAKYRFVDAPVALASNLILRLPTGSQGDFHGTGDATILGGGILSRSFGREEVHGSLGFEFNVDDLQRTRARYAIGASFQVWNRLAYLVDIVGSSSFVDDDFDLPAPAGSVFNTQVIHQLFGNDALIKSIGPTKIVAIVPRSDVVDIAVGVKVNLFGSAVGFASAIVPLTTDGLRAEVIPAGGIEYGF